MEHLFIKEPVRVNEELKQILIINGSAAVVCRLGSTNTPELVNNRVRLFFVTEGSTLRGLSDSKEEGLFETGSDSVPVDFSISHCCHRNMQSSWQQVPV